MKGRWERFNRKERKEHKEMRGVFNREIRGIRKKDGLKRRWRRVCGTSKCMNIKVLTFAQTRDQLGFAERMVECSPAETPRAILRRIAPDFAPGPVRVALDLQYADWDQPVGAAVELALIPPVSGG